MLYFNFSVRPFKFEFNIRIPLPFNTPQVFAKHWYGKTSIHKGWEAETWFEPLSVLLELDFRLTFSGEDHAGLRVGGNVLGLFGEFIWQDNRHWNYLEDRWYEPAEQEKEWDEEEEFRQYQALQKEALPLLRKIRDSFLHVEDGPNYTEYVGVDLEADMHFFDEICTFINKYREYDEEFGITEKAEPVFSPVPPPAVPPTV